MAAIGPKEILVPTEDDLAKADRIEEIINRALKELDTWDGGEIKICVDEFAPLPNLAVQSEVTRRYTEGEDSWSSVGFVAALLGGWNIALSP